MQEQGSELTERLYNRIRLGNLEGVRECFAAASLNACEVINFPPFLLFIMGLLYRAGGDNALTGVKISGGN